MFGLFKKQNLADTIIELLRPFYGDMIELINQTGTPCIHLYEAGIFVSSIATLKIFTFKKNDPTQTADEFNSRWIDYLAKNPNEKTPPSREMLITRMQQRYPVYRNLFLTAVDSNCKETESSPSVQLMWELFTNCTGKQQPSDFLKMMVIAQVLTEIAMEVFNAVTE